MPPLVPRRKKERRRLALLGGTAGAALSVLIITIFLASGLSQVLLRSSSVASVVATTLVDLANGDRASSGLPALTVNPLLVAAAQAKAGDMAAKSYFAHTSPEGLDPWHWFKQAGYTFRHAGENLAVDFSDSADVERAWMNSPKHRDNILDPKFTEIGIATAVGTYKGRTTVFVVQEFGTPAEGVKQASVRTASVPLDPTTLAVASTDANIPAVAGTQTGQTAEPLQQTEPQKKTAVVKKVAAAVPAPAAAEPARDAAEAEPAVQKAQVERPLWAYAVSFPKSTLKIAYYVLGLLILLILAWSVRYELEKHHVRHATAAAGLLSLMGLLLMAANMLFFTEPVLAAVAASL